MCVTAVQRVKEALEVQLLGTTAKGGTDGKSSPCPRAETWAAGLMGRGQEAEEGDPSLLQARVLCVVRTSCCCGSCLRCGSVPLMRVLGCHSHPPALGLF